MKIEQMDMLGEPGVFAAEHLTAVAIEQAALAADQGWVAVADKAVEFLAETRAELTADDVWNLLSEWYQPPREPRALGSVMRRAATRGLIARTNRWVDSTRKERHKGGVKVWASKTYAPNPSK